MIYEILRGVSLTVLLLSACVYDLRTYRIPNALCGCFIILGCLLNLGYQGPAGLLHALTGALIPVAGLFILYAFCVLGAGDIKLLAAVGSFVSFRILRVICFSFLFCALYGLVLLPVHLAQKRLRLSRTHFSLWIAAGTLAAFLTG